MIPFLAVFVFIDNTSVETPLVYRHQLETSGQEFIRLDRHRNEAQKICPTDLSEAALYQVLNDQAWALCQYQGKDRALQHWYAEQSIHDHLAWEAQGLRLVHTEVARRKSVYDYRHAPAEALVHVLSEELYVPKAEVVYTLWDDRKLSSADTAWILLQAQFSPAETVDALMEGLHMTQEDATETVEDAQRRGQTPASDDATPDSV